MDTVPRTVMFLVGVAFLAIQTHLLPKIALLSVTMRIVAVLQSTR